MSHGLHFQTHSTHGSLKNQLPTLVLIHGLFGNSDNLSVIRRAFEHERSVISIDLPDHGKSLHTQSFSFEDYANRVAAALTALNISECALAGHSLGGKVSMLVAQKLPNVVKQLVIMDIAPVAYSARHQNVFKGLNNVNLASITSRSDAKQQLAEYVQDPGTQAFLLKSLYQDDDHLWQWRFNLPLIARDYSALIAWTNSGLCYSGPTLFIKGAESDYILPQHQSAIVEQFPQAKAKIVQAGHWLHAQKPQVVNALITKFLRGQ